MYTNFNFIWLLLHFCGETHDNKNSKIMISPIIVLRIILLNFICFQSNLTLKPHYFDHHFFRGFINQILGSVIKLSVHLHHVFSSICPAGLELHIGARKPGRIF